MLPYEKEGSIFVIDDQFTETPRERREQNHAATPVDLRKQIASQSRPCCGNAPQLGRFRSQVPQQELSAFPGNQPKGVKFWGSGV